MTLRQCACWTLRERPCTYMATGTIPLPPGPGTDGNPYARQLHVCRRHRNVHLRGRCTWYKFDGRLTIIPGAVDLTDATESAGDEANKASVW